MSCSGDPCSKVTYLLTKFSPKVYYHWAPNKSFEASDFGYAKQTDSPPYHNMWYFSLLVWLMPGVSLPLPLEYIPVSEDSPSPFKNVEPKCEGDDCECDLGPEVKKEKEYTYKKTFNGKDGILSIDGSFTMTVISQSGTCTVKAGIDFSMKSDTDEKFFASLAKFKDVGTPVDSSISVEGEKA
jgi:hypothetical protein